MDPTKEIVVGEWYFCVECPHCGAVIPLWHDKSRGRIKLSGPDSTVKVKCGKCGQQGEVPADSLYSGEVTKRPD